MIQVVFNDNHNDYELEVNIAVLWMKYDRNMKNSFGVVCRTSESLQIQSILRKGDNDLFCFKKYNNATTKKVFLRKTGVTKSKTLCWKELEASLASYECKSFNCHKYIMTFGGATKHVGTASRM